MSYVVGTVALTTWMLCAQPPQTELYSFLHYLQRGPDHIYRPAVKNYQPQPGDMVFYDDYNVKWGILYAYVGSGPPFHSGIFFRRPDGSMAVLESGPDDNQYVFILDGVPRLHQFHRDFPKGDIWIRQLKTPLSKEASDQLTAFALAQEGKKYALGRLLLQGTPVRCRGPLRCKWFGKTDLNRDRWLCSELVVAGGTVAGLFDPNICHANAIYPRDIIGNHKYPIGHIWEDAALWRPSAHPVARSLIPR
jgi:hypothetical protein